MDSWGWVKWLFVAAGTVIVNFLGGWDIALKVLVAFVVMDYVTGLIAAWVSKNLDSGVGFKGIAKKIILFVPVAVGYWLDTLLGQAFFRSLAIFFYIANEGLSIVENLGIIGVPFPAAIADALKQIRDKEGKAVPDEPDLPKGPELYHEKVPD
ncbi:MAG TPA: phage holin family protein [Syntrophomonadaceae bacterium]|nr:phage holin family protein [Syntrophomonadaceae bacterium]